eukprot:4733213-Amphidinium_carterae.1
MRDMTDVALKAPHRYVSAHHRARLSGMLDHSGVPIPPSHVDDALAKFWEAVESPSDYDSFDVAAAVLARFPVTNVGHFAKVDTHAAQVQGIVAKMKAITAAGPDEWHQHECRALPITAYQEFVARMQDDLHSGALSEGLYDTRVTMVPKAIGEAQLGKLRPISVFSVMIRAWNTAALRNHNPALAQMLHKGQRAAQQGAWCYEFVAIQLHRIERLQRARGSAWGIALDLSTAYNTLNRHLPMAVAVHKGMDFEAAQLLFGWIGQVRTVFQLPLRRVGESHASLRGWPQGMGTSPRACDLCLLPLFESVDALDLTGQLSMMESWQDDIQALAEHFGPFWQLLQLITDFMHEAKLAVNQEKSIVWHINGEVEHVNQLTNAGWVIKHEFTSLGFVVPVMKQ